MTNHPPLTIGRRTASRRDQRGFTLVELMVVVLIIGILLGIAIPTFLGARSRSQDGVAKASLRNALTAAQVIYSDQQTFKTADAKNLAANEGSLNYVDSPSNSNEAKTISVAAGDEWGGAAMSASGTCFMIKANGKGAVNYGSAEGSKCTGEDALGQANSQDW